MNSLKSKNKSHLTLIGPGPSAPIAPLVAYTTDYAAFLAQKHVAAPSCGFKVKGEDLLYPMFGFQKHVTAWMLGKGRSAAFADTGLGKTRMQSYWSHEVATMTKERVLLLTPPKVGRQTAKEMAALGLPIGVAHDMEDVKANEGTRIWTTNYERLHLFNPDWFAGVALDESSILKSFTGATKQKLISMFLRTLYKSSWTATPAPNDYLELGNQAEFLGVMPSNEMIARWFINDTMAAGGYRLKKHAEKDFWRWVASWAISLSKPSDVGAEFAHEDARYILPPLQLIPHVLDAPSEQAEKDGRLFESGGSLSATSLHKTLRGSLEMRAAQVAELVAQTAPGTPWLLWCHTNYEADAVTDALKAIGRADEFAEVRGSDTPKQVETKLDAFEAQSVPILCTKPSICGWGLNWQHCQNMAFVGLSYSFESFYQAVRRSWRFGQTLPVSAHLVYTDAEGDIAETLRRKQSEHEAMKAAMVVAVRENSDAASAENHSASLVEAVPYRVVEKDNYTIEQGDSCQLIQSIPDESVGLTVTSPPFANLYIYSDAVADMGNAADYDEFFAHFKFLIRQLLRVTKTGRVACIHCKDLPLYKGRDGAAGLVDFPGDIIRAFNTCHTPDEYLQDPTLPRWAYHSRVTIWKDPVIEMQRTKNHGLLYKNLRADSTQSRQGMADFILTFRKWPGVDGPDYDPVPHTKEEFPLSQWQEWASPVWMDVNQTRVLNYQIAKENGDEKHICPLQLDDIERCIALWSKRGDVVYDPFFGIGSTGYMAVKMGRKARGSELKPAYFNHAVSNMERAQVESGQTNIFDFGAAGSAAPKSKELRKAA